MGLGTPGSIAAFVGLGTSGNLTVVFGVGHSRESPGSPAANDIRAAWVGWVSNTALQRISRWSLGLDTPGQVSW